MRWRGHLITRGPPRNRWAQPADQLATAACSLDHRSAHLTECAVHRGAPRRHARPPEVAGWLVASLIPTCRGRYGGAPLPYHADAPSCGGGGRHRAHALWPRETRCVRAIELHRDQRCATRGAAKVGAATAGNQQQPSCDSRVFVARAAHTCIAWRLHGGHTAWRRYGGHAAWRPHGPFNWAACPRR